MLCFQHFYYCSWSSNRIGSGWDLADIAIPKRLTFLSPSAKALILSMSCAHKKPKRRSRTHLASFKLSQH